jgi:SAM-dependent methyltransferase
LYSRHLSFIHDTAFGDFSRRVAPEVVRILHRAGIRDGTVIEVGCGSGELARRLTAAGFTVYGFDVSPAMIARARRRAPDATFRVADLTTAAIPRCEAVVSIGEVVTYARGGLPVLRRFFRRVHDALPPGGLLLFDFMHSARGRTYPPRTLRGRGWSMTVRADYSARTRTLTRHIDTVRRIGTRTHRGRETHAVRIYDRQSMVSALRRIGFHVSASRSIGPHPLLPGDTAVAARRARRTATHKG